jgi:hypothetical protein
MLLPSEILLLSALAISSTASSSPVPAPQGPVQYSNFLDWPQSPFSSYRELPVSHNGYQCYINNHPDSHEWLSWNHLWDINREQVLSSNGGDTYIQHYVKESILEVAEESNVDARLILAVVMQESKGKAKCKGKARCGMTRSEQRFDERRPRESVLRMLRNGVEGQSGLAETLKRSGLVYAAMWRYHEQAGFDESMQNEARYMSDVANRLLGWNGRGKGFKECG